MTRTGRAHPLEVLGAQAGLWTLAVAQPLLELLGRNPEFFIVRRFPRLDLALLVGGLLAVGVVIGLAVWALMGRHRRLGNIANTLLLALAAALVVASTLVNLGWAHLAPTVFGAVTLAGGFFAAHAFWRWPYARTGLALLGLAPIALGAWFLAYAPTAQLLAAASPDLPEAVRVRQAHPVVVIVYDELPAATLMAADGTLDGERFPNFARLAADGVWYRNAVGVYQQTEEALPAILTGRYVPASTIPTAASHPFNLFTMLSAGYEVRALEHVTELCPPFVCENQSRWREPSSQRWRSLRYDLAVVYGHLVTPRDVSRRLPPIDHSWGGFTEATTEQFDMIERFLERVDQDRRREVERFVDLLDFGPRPALRFAHFLYPHHPWELTEDGRRHSAPRPVGRVGVGWGEDEFLVAQGYQRHLLQAMYTDRMLGRILDRLAGAGVYDDALVVVVADHGISVRPGVEHQRVVTPETIGSIAMVPLFVKYPAGAGLMPLPGSVDDLRAETLDIVPTVAEVLGTEVPWEVDGVSLLDREARLIRLESVVHGSYGTVSVGLDPAPLLAEVAFKERWFPGGDPYALAPPGWGELLGEAVRVVDDEEVVVTVDQEAELATFVPGDDPVPAYLSGTVSTGAATTGQEVLAVIAGEQVVAVTRSHSPSGLVALWEVMIPPATVDGDASSLEVVLVTGSPAAPELRR